MAAAPANADRDLDNLIFNEKKEEKSEVAPVESTDKDVAQPQGDDSDGDEKKPAARTSIANVLPVDKLKNGASAAAGYVVEGVFLLVGERQ